MGRKPSKGQYYQLTYIGDTALPDCYYVDENDKVYYWSRMLYGWMKSSFKGRGHLLSNVPRLIGPYAGATPVPGPFGQATEFRGWEFQHGS